VRRLQLVELLWAWLPAALRRLLLRLADADSHADTQQGRIAVPDAVAHAALSDTVAVAHGLCDELCNALRHALRHGHGHAHALALAHAADYADTFLAGMKARGKLDLIDAITFHGYPRNPDDTALVDKLRAIGAKHGRVIALRQGETGAPSRFQENFALSKISFTETTHAKWDLRRLLAHHAKDVPMNLFTLSDLHYTTASAQGGADGLLRMNYKGLLATNPDQTVAYAKPAYRAAQTVFAVFDDTLVRVADYPFATTALRAVALSGYRRERDGAQVVALWFSDAPPADANGVSLADVTLRAGKFTEPVLVDVRTSTVYALPKAGWSQSEQGAVFRALPIYDSPLLIAEKSVLGIPAAR
jgi:hypothetical protein